MHHDQRKAAEILDHAMKIVDSEWVFSKKITVVEGE